MYGTEGDLFSDYDTVMCSIPLLVSDPFQTFSNAD